jgi:hypothetical protein
MSNKNIQIMPLPDKKLLVSNTTDITGIESNGTAKYTPNGKYVVSSSSFSSDKNMPYLVFNGNVNEEFWQSDYADNKTISYNKTYPLYNSNPYSGEESSIYQGGGSNENTWITKYKMNNENKTLMGEWIQIKLPYKVSLTKYSLMTPDYSEYCTFPNTFFVLGSNDGNFWELLDKQNTKDLFLNDNNPFREFEINNDRPFSYYRLVISEMKNKINKIMLKQWNMFGTTDNNSKPYNSNEEGFTTLSRSFDLILKRENFDNMKDVNKQIDELKIKADNYVKDLNAINTNSVYLRKNMNEITNKKQTGVRDILMSNPKYDFNGNTLNLRKPKYIEDAMLEDINDRISYNNTTFLIGSITIVTLLIFSIVIGSK